MSRRTRWDFGNRVPLGLVSIVSRVHDSIHSAAAIGFDRGAAEYERGRPGYPHEATVTLAHALRVGPATTVLDLAAGTGKLSSALAELGAAVIAVEPVPAMRETLAARLPEVRVLAGTAEAIPLDEECVDAVAVGQAFHWFDGGRALAEIHRVLRRGGRLGLVWNKRDETARLQQRISTLIEPYRGDAPAHATRAWQAAFSQTSLFGELEERRFPWTHRTDVDGLVARVTSISFIAALPEDEKGAVVERVRALVPCGEPVELAYVTYVYWTERRER